jgi:hypothetical protein
LQLTLFDTRDMASITSPDFPGERLVVCRNPDLAPERSRKREESLAATEKGLARIKNAVERKRNPLHGTAAIALAVGEVLKLPGGLQWHKSLPRQLLVCAPARTERHRRVGHLPDARRHRD